MKKSTSTSHKNPISIKAYNEFTRRIRAVFSKPGDADDVISALDKYLDDDPDYAKYLNSRSVVGMSFLLYDVELAVARSRRARERAAARRAAKEAERCAAAPDGEGVTERDDALGGKGGRVGDYGGGDGVYGGGGRLEAVTPWWRRRFDEGVTERDDALGGEGGRVGDYGGGDGVYGGGDGWKPSLHGGVDASMRVVSPVMPKVYSKFDIQNY